jgi:hypothetical protein
MEEKKLNDTCEIQAVYHTRAQSEFATFRNIAKEPAGTGGPRYFPSVGVQKKIRASHGKEKQLPEELVQPPESP